MLSLWKRFLMAIEDRAGCAGFIVGVFFSFGGCLCFIF